MSTIKNLLTEAFLEANTIPSNYGYGTAIYARGAVKFIREQPDNIEAWAGGLDGTVKEGAGSRRRVTLTVTDGRLHWRCTGNPKHHQIFCKHCVAVALAVLKR